MKNKTTLLGLLAIVLSLSLCISAFAIDNSDKMQNVMPTNKEVVSIDGLNGHISIMPSKYNEVVTPKILSSNGVSINDNYAGCAGSKRRIKDNGLYGSHAYKTNSQTCKVEHQETTTTYERCGNKVRWSNQMDNWVEGMPIFRFKYRQYSGICTNNKKVWVEVDTTKPAN